MYSYRNGFKFIIVCYYYYYIFFLGQFEATLSTVVMSGEGVCQVTRLAAVKQTAGI